MLDFENNKVAPIIQLEREQLQAASYLSNVAEQECCLYHNAWRQEEKGKKNF